MSLKKVQDIIIIGLLFLASAYVLQVIDFWSLIGLSQPKGMYLQGVIFIALWAILRVFLFQPFLAIDQERIDQTQGKRKLAQAQTQEAKEMMEEYQNAIAQAKIKATQAKQSIAMDAEEQEKKTLAHARSVSDQDLDQKLRDLRAQASQAQDELQGSVEAVAQTIMNQVLHTPEKGA